MNVNANMNANVNAERSDRDYFRLENVSRSISIYSVVKNWRKNMLLTVNMADGYGKEKRWRDWVREREKSMEVGSVFVVLL